MGSKYFDLSFKGLNIKEVNKYIKNMENSYKEQLDLLDGELKSLSDRRTMLEKDMEKLKNKNPGYNLELLEFALKYTEKLDLLFKDFIKKECVDLNSAYNDKLGKYREKAKNMESGIYKTKDYLRLFMQDIVKLINKSNDTPLPESDPSKSKENKPSILLFKKGQEHLKEKKQLEKITADGISSWNGEGMREDKTKEADVLNKDTILPFNKKGKTQTSPGKSDFWDIDVDELTDESLPGSGDGGLLDENIILPGVPPAYKEPEGNDPRDCEERDEPHTNQGDGKAAENEEKNPDTENMDMAKSYKEAADEKERPGIVSKSSKALEIEIDELRIKYIVGKLAGKDIFDKNGNIVISEGSKITPEVIQNAENEEKLAELIINMKIPEFGE